MTKPPMVLVVWEDATTIDGGPWAVNEPAAYKPHLVHQVGFLMSKTDAGVILTQAWHPTLIAARDQIPAGMIRSITVLRAGRPK